LWHPLLLLNHVALVSTIAYVWEAKRPPLTRGHLWSVVGGLTLVNCASIALVGWRRHGRFGVGYLDALAVTPALLFPALAVLLFAAFGLGLYLRVGKQRRAGQTLMSYGLLWLIVYDAAFAAGYVNFASGAMILSLLPLAYLSVQLLRWWGKVLSLSQKPEFQRVR
ncbi:MAG: hypothetical protein ACREJC_21725, partial [Tepidisphaeraceae bacterium]